MLKCAVGAYLQLYCLGSSWLVWELWRIQASAAVWTSSSLFLDVNAALYGR
jgi:hypothetical protein